MLFDGPVGEEAWPEDGSVGPPLMALGEEEIDLLQKVQEVIRANPGKAESLFGKFHKILKEEGKEDLMCNHCPPVLNDGDGWDGSQMGLSLPPSPDSGSVKTLQISTLISMLTLYNCQSSPTVISKKLSLIRILSPV